MLPGQGQGTSVDMGFDVAEAESFMDSFRGEEVDEEEVAMIRHAPPRDQ